MMFLLFILPVLATLFNLPSESSGCSLVARGVSLNVGKCVSYKYIRVENAHVTLGVVEPKRIQLEEPRKDVRVYCGRYSTVYSWKKTKKNGNQIRVSFLEGVLHLGVYWCDNFDGPKRAGIHCAIEAFSKACPGRASGNHTCVYEVKTKYFSRDTVRNAVEVKTEVAAEIKKALVSAGVSHIEERTHVNTYTFESRSYIVIPAGYRFCSFSEVFSKKDALASTGFKWKCKVPTYIQTTDISGRCTGLVLCDNRSPCPTASQYYPSGSGPKSPVALLLVLCIVVSSKFQ